MCLSLPACQELYLVSGMPTPTHSLYSPGLTSPLIQGTSEATRQSLDFYSRQQPQRSMKGREQGSCLQTSVSLLEHEWKAGFQSQRF